MGNTRAEQELGRKITEARRADTERQRAAWAAKQQAEREAEEQRVNEIYNLGKQYEIPEPRVAAPLPPPSEEEIAEAVKRKKSRS